MGFLRYCLLEAFAGAAPSVLVEDWSTLRRGWLARGAWFVKIVIAVVVFVLSLAVAPTMQAQNKTAQEWAAELEARVAEIQVEIILDDLAALEREAPRVCESLRVTVKLRERQHRETPHLFKGVDLEEFPYMTASMYKDREEGCRERLADLSKWSDEWSDEYASYTGDELTKVYRASDGWSGTLLKVVKDMSLQLMQSFCVLATDQADLLEIEKQYGLSGVPHGIRLLANKAAVLGQNAKDTICPWEHRGVYKLAPDGSKLSDN